MIFTLAALIGASGCTSIRVTNPARTATEQFLLSVAAQLAVEQLDVSALVGEKVFVDATHYAAEEKEFVVGTLRAHLLKSGARLMVKREDAAVILEVRSGGVGIDRAEFLLGLPSIPLGAIAEASVGGVPVPFSTPELALLKHLEQVGYASVAFVAYRADDGEVLTLSGPMIGVSLRDDWWVLGLGPNSKGNIATIDDELPKSAQSE